VARRVSLASPGPGQEKRGTMVDEERLHRVVGRAHPERLVLATENP
jgi:hypothetical protein